MKKVTLYIESDYDKREVSLDDEISIGRTDSARIVLEDVGLSRVNTTFFRDGDDVLVVDENSTNGTFVNGKKISGTPKLIFNGDEIKLGNDTRIRVEISSSRQSTVGGQQLPTTSIAASKDKGQRTKDKPKNPKSKIQNPKSDKPPFVIIAAVGSIILIVFVTVIGFWMSDSGEVGNGNTKTRPTPKINTAIAIPIRVVDPMGGGEPDDNLDDLIAAWETQEEQIKVEDLDKITSKTSTTSPTSGETVKPSDLNVSIEFFKQQLNKAINHGNPGIPDPPGLISLPAELIGGNVSKQKAKLAELMQRDGYKQPLDFADLAQHRMDGKFLGELPMATETYVLDIGGSATEGEFTSFEFEGGNTKLAPDSAEYQVLKKLADNFDGQKYDLTNGRDRRQMRIRLLRMYNKQSRKTLEEIAKAYYDKFKNPLRFSSLLRSMDYQISLNKTNANSFVVRGKGSLPPHTSGCAIDIPRRTLTAAEQNFLMTFFAEMERANKIDALREGASNPCFHFFIYPDGKLADPSVKFAMMEKAEEIAELFNLPSPWATFYD